MSHWWSVCASENWPQGGLCWERKQWTLAVFFPTWHWWSVSAVDRKRLAVCEGKNAHEASESSRNSSWWFSDGIKQDKRHVATNCALRAALSEFLKALGCGRGSCWGDTGLVDQHWNSWIFLMHTFYSNPVEKVLPGVQSNSIKSTFLSLYLCSCPGDTERNASSSKS